MTRLISLVVVFFGLLLQGCDTTDSLSSDNSVRIGYITKENVIPAKWEFSFESDETLQSFQWQFSDENFANNTAGNSRKVDHTFTQAGLHKIRLSYTTQGGRKGVAETEVIIQSGSIHGEIFSALNTLVDIDTRDPNEPPGNNDSFSSAQPLTASTRISGVVDVNDTVDFYQVQLQKNQSINLQVADQVNRAFESIQFQVYNSDDTSTPIFDGVTQQSNGHLSLPFIAPENNSYFIKLSAVSPRIYGAKTHSHGIYSLHIEAAIDVASFVKGELVVMMKENRQYQAQGLTNKVNLGRIKAVSLSNARQFMAAKNISFGAQLENNTHWQTLQAARILASQEDVLYAEPNWKRYPSAELTEVSDPLFPSQWHYSAINLESAWQAMGERGSDSVTVAVLDTGVLLSHPDLSGNLVAGYDFIDNDSDANDPGDKSISGQRSSFHGTHVAGTVAATEGNAIGGTGVAPGVKIMPVRVLGRDGGTSIQIISGLCFAAQLNTNDSSLCGNVPQGDAADVINLSLGGPGFSNTEQAVYDAIIAKGIIVIAAAGNESVSTPYYPAAYDGVISVSATNRKTELASYSNYGNTIDVAAPGGDYSDLGIMSTWGDDLGGSVRLTYGYLQGTSMATPHVAGVAALMKSIKPELTHIEFQGLLIAGDLTQDIGSAGRDNSFGYGLIDAQKSVLGLLESRGPQILSSASSLFFDVSQSTRSFTISGTGISNDSELGTINYVIEGADVSGSGSWLSLDRNSGLGEFTATVNRGDIEEGAYEAKIIISSDIESISNVEIKVSLQVGNAELSANAGVQYVLVLDANAVENTEGVLPSIAGSSALLANNGQYIYQISGLPKGRYTLSTGSDLDLDDVVCDAGESCGQYPTLSQPSILTISEESIDLRVDMTVNYLTTSIGRSALATDASRAPKPIGKPNSLNGQTLKAKQGN